MARAAWLLLLLGMAAYAQAGDADITWEEYKAKYKKTYASPEEEDKHHQNFLAALKHVELHNQRRLKGEVSYSIGINQFSDQERAGVSKPPDAAGAEEQPKLTGSTHGDAPA